MIPPLQAPVPVPVASIPCWDEMDLQSFDDGHVPENLTQTHPDTKLLDSPLFHRQAPSVHVFYDALPEPLVDRAFEKTRTHTHPSWGEYVTIRQIQDYWNGTTTPHGTTEESASSCSESDVTTIALAAEYLALTVGKDQRVPTVQLGRHSGTHHSLWNIDDLDQAHGVAVWALRAHIGSQVPYHLDYAEQVRYQSNVIVPPLVAGTLQCTRAKIIGGDFLVAVTEGLEHYAKHGYKGKFVEPKDLASIPYRFNQLTCHLGDLPHASTQVEDIQGEGDDAIRVIVGFNVFPHAIGALVQQAPEHSEAFRRMVTSRSRNKNNNNKMLSLENVKENKALSRLLVLAKRLKVQEDFRRAQEQLEVEIPKYLPATVQNLMDQFCTADTSQWSISSTELQVYLDHQIHRGRFKVLQGGTTAGSTYKDIITPTTIIGHVESQTTIETRPQKQ